jgi:hypothetical protein
MAVTPALANPAVEAAVKVLATIPSDKAKLEAYCKAVGEIKAATGADQSKADAADDAFDAVLKSFGPAFETVVTLSHEIEDSSADGQVLNAGFAEVEKNCGR